MATMTPIEMRKDTENNHAAERKRVKKDGVLSLLTAVVRAYEGGGVMRRRSRGGRE